MIYIKVNNKMDFTQNTEQLKKMFDLLYVQKATCIKSRRPTPTLFLITIKEKLSPRYLDTPVKHAKTKVYGYYKIPIRCIKLKRQVRNAATPDIKS